MAYIVDYAITENAAGGATSITCNIPPHDPNDILLCIAAINGSTTVSMTGWTQIGTTQTANAGITSAAFWLRADVTDAETGTVTLSVADDYTIKVICIRDVDTTTAVDVQVSSNSGTATASEWTSPSVTTTTADCLLIFAHALDGSVPQAHSNPGIHHLISSDATGTTANTSAHASVSWYIQRTAGVTPTPGWTANAAAVRTNHTIAFRNKSGGRIPAYIDDISSPGTNLHMGIHIGTLNNTVVTTTFTSTAAINGKTVGTSTAALGADFGINPYSNALGRTGAITAATALNGYQITFTGNRNLSTGLVMGALIAGSPKMGTFGLGSLAQGGFVVRLGSSSTAWNAYQVAAKDTATTTENRYVFAIEPGYVGTAYGSTQGTPVNTAAISHAQFLLNCPSFASVIYLSDLTQVFTQIVAGGDANFPVNIDGLAQIGRSFRIPVLQKNGASVLMYAPVQIGGGDAVNFQIDSSAIQFPRRYDQDAKEIAFHARDNKIGISFAGKTGDVIKLTNSIVTSPTSYYWEINSAASSAATWDFTGLKVINAVVTLRPVVTFSSMAFSACTRITQTSSVVDNCTFDSCYTELNNPANISNCSFTNINNTPAIEIITAGTYTFSGNTFNNYSQWGGTTTYSGNITTRTSGTTNAIYSASYINGVYFITGNAFIRYSSNLSTWTAATGVTFTGFYSKIKYINGVYVTAQVDSATTYLTSTNGTTWTSRSTGSIPPEDFCYTGLVSILVGNSGGIATNSTTITDATWTSRTSNTTADLTAIVWTGKKAVALGNGVCRRSDATGVTWETITLPNAYLINQAATNGYGTVVALTNVSDVSNGVIFTSTDHGATWSSINVSSLILSSPASIVWVGAKFIITAFNGFISESIDGLVWTNKTSGVTTNFSGNGFGNGQLVLGTENGSLYTVPVTNTGNPAIINTSGGTVTLNITGGGTVPSVIPQSTTVVNLSANLTFEGLIAGTEVRVYLGTNPSTATEIGGTESSGTSFSFSQSYSGQSGFYTIHALNYNSIYQTIVFSNTDQVIPVVQSVDRTYTNP